MRSILIVCALTATADASPLFELVGDPIGPGGLTARVSADDASAAYFDPALLADAPIGFDLGSFFVSEQIGVILDGRGCGGSCDVPSVSNRGPESFRHGGTGDPIENPTIPTDWLEHGHGMMTPRPRQGAGTGHETRAYQTLGLVTPLFGKRLMLGMFAMIPLGEFTTARAFYVDEREQYFSNSLHPELYGDRMTATSLAFGGGFHLPHHLSAGATFTLSLANHAQAPVYISNLNNLDTVELDSDIAVDAAVAPHFGLAWTPKPGMRAALTVHTPQAFKIDTGFDYILATGSEQSTTVHFTHSYEPMTIGLGGTYPVASNVEARAVATWGEWSHYHDRHDERPGGEYPWSDTISIAAGGAWKSGATKAWLDLSFVPTPVPPQTGRSSYVDSDRAGLAAGLERRFELWGSRFRVGLDLTGDHLFYRHTKKFIAPKGSTAADYPELVVDEVPDDAIDVLGIPVENRSGLQTNNPGFPGFASHGWIFGGGAHVSVEY